MHRGEEVWCHVDIVAVKKYNYEADYNMDGNTICNDGGNITSVTRTERRMMDVDDVNSEVAAE